MVHQFTDRNFSQNSKYFRILSIVSDLPLGKLDVDAQTANFILRFSELQVLK